MAKGFVALAVGIALTGLCMTANAGPWGPGAGPRWGGPRMGMEFWNNPRVAQLLGLSSEQVSQLQALRQESFKEAKPLREKLLAKKMELRLLWGSVNPDQAQIMAKQRELNELMTQLQEMRTRHRLEARKILTPEQQQRLLSLGWGGGMGHGRWRGGRCW